MMMRKIVSVILFQSLCSLGAAHALPAEAPGPEKDTRISMRLIEIPESKSTFAHRYFVLDPTEPSRIPFPTKSGHLLLKRQGRRLRVDRNGNGKFDEADGETVRKGETFHVLCSHAGEEVFYSFRVAQIYPRSVDLESRSALIGYNNEWLALILDNNLDGRFGQPGKDHFKLTAFSRNKIRQLAVSGDTPFWTTGVVPLGEVTFANGELLSLKVEENGNILSLRPYAGERGMLEVETSACHAETTTITIDGVKVDIQKAKKKVIVVSPGEGENLVVSTGPALGGYSFMLAHTEGVQYQQVSDCGKTVMLVPGAYRMLDLNLIFDLAPKRETVWLRKPGEIKRRKAVLSGERERGYKIVDIQPGENALKLGPPLELEFEAAVWGEDHDQFMVEQAYLVGAGGEIYRFQLSGEVQSFLHYSFRIGTEDLFLGALEPTRFGFDRSWRKIPKEYATHPEAEVELKFSAAGMDSITRRKKLADLRRDHPPGSIMLGNATDAMQAGRFSEAKNLFIKAAASYPDNARVQNDSAWYLLVMDSTQHREPKIALKLAWRAAELSHYQNGLLLDTLALALYRTGDLEKALKYQELAVKLEPSNAELQARLDEFREAIKRETGIK
ncbi:MAG: tetratricopeptide repeat protein [Planctomycetota bacterium]|jgi:tetratricopeptide (TPR) repeat protein